MLMQKFDEAAAALPSACFEHKPDLGILLGSGWGDALQADEVLARVRYADIPGLGASTVVGHAGMFLLYRCHGKTIAAWCGRRHYYEGEGWEPVVMPIELLRRMGCTALLLTNAAGGINPTLEPGDFVVIRDHVNLINVNPLIGPHRPEWGVRFPDMSTVYDAEFVRRLSEGARKLSLRAMEGVYAYNSGPCYETPAEVRAYKLQGVDVVGMSTVPEAVFARSCGFRIGGLSLVANLAAGIARHPLNHAEVMAAGEAAKPKMAKLIGDFIDRI